MDHFCRRVDRRSRERMVGFLRTHFRYHTMNSWNLATSYAHCVKLHRLGMPQALYAQAFEVLQTGEVRDAWEPVIDAFTASHEGRASIAFNGRSGGYLVLYESRYEDSGYRSYCGECGQRNYQLATPKDCECGRCGARARVNYTVPPRGLVIWPGQGMDETCDFSDWSLRALRERVGLVQAFDRACDEIRANFIDRVRSCDVVEQNYVVTQQRKVLVNRTAAV